VKNFLIAGAAGAAVTMLAVLVYLWLSHAEAIPFHSGFTDAEVRQCEQTIKDYYLNQIKNSGSEKERQELESGLTTVEVRMIKVSDRRLEGYAKITINTQQAREVGLSEINQICDATMGVDSPQFIWKCHPER
jgi:hypothetical protein